jgi:anti-anti-sigma factor
MIVRCHVDTTLTDAIVSNVFGPLNEKGAAKVWDAVSDELSREHPSLMVDLSEVDLITSAGIGALVRIHHRVHNLGGTLALFGANSRAREVIEAVMLADVLNLCDTIDDARTRLPG